MTDLRVGLGVDVHRRDEGKPLSLGGVRFPGDAGLAAHSDGDVICHALADALLGAAGLGDLGEHFPDTDARYEGMSGLDLLGRVVAMVRESRNVPVSCDVTFLGERPSIAPRRGAIRTNLATALGVDVTAVSVKATRPEGLGLSGDGAGCLALAVLRPAADG
jgi:2-C-methyl-D-erythritol 2,4-cyclodiphosphate synthase